MKSKEFEVEFHAGVLWNMFLLVNYAFFAMFIQPYMYIQTVQAVRQNAFGPARYNAPDESSSDYQRAQEFFRAPRGPEQARAGDNLVDPVNQNDGDQLLLFDCRL